MGKKNLEKSLKEYTVKMAGVFTVCVEADSQEAAEAEALTRRWNLDMIEDVVVLTKAGKVLR